jgi:AraC-like DNA-binding protein
LDRELGGRTNILSTRVNRRADQGKEQDQEEAHKELEPWNEMLSPLFFPLSSRRPTYSHARETKYKTRTQTHAHARTDLEQRFRRWLHTSVRLEILRRRMDRACWLLQQSDLSLDEVARAAGLATATHLCRLFQRHLGKTPGQYRQHKKPL